MSMITIYGSKQSRATRILWLLGELGQAYELKNIDLQAKEQKSPEYLAINPNGTVPTLDDNGFILFESFAIGTYLADKYKPELIGMTPEERGQVHQWNYWTVNNLETHCNAIGHQKWSNENNEVIIAKATEALDKYMAILDKYLEGKSYLVNNKFSLADLNASAIINYAKKIGYDVDRFANVKTYFEKNLTREGYVKAIA